jgi:hypothetical protein
MNFRQKARDALNRAKENLDNSNPEYTKYAALELRMAIEGLTYDRANAYIKEIDPQEYKTWQPRKVMEMLLEIEPMADKGSSLSFGIEDKLGEPAKIMTSLGSEEVFNLSLIKKYYDALGSFLHLPTIKQLQDKPETDIKKRREKCLEIINHIEKVLKSPVFNITLGSFSEITCLRCNQTIRKRIPYNQTEVVAKCLNPECVATYLVADAGEGKVGWEPQLKNLECMAENCSETTAIWQNDIRAGVHWKCGKCNKEHLIRLSVFAVESNSGA